MTPIKICGMQSCAYNMAGRCHTLGISVGPHAECNTYVHASSRGGYNHVNGGVGACLASDCKFNDLLECRASDVVVSAHEKHADCETFQER
jgi:hypothetical protein